jgi:hypothetical protein
MLLPISPLSPPGTVTRKLIPPLYWLAALVFLVSWFLPVLEGVPGWQAFRYALAPLVPYQSEGPSRWEGNVPTVLSALTNLVFLVLFGLWLARQTIRPGLWIRIALACVLLNLYWPVKALREDNLAALLVGFWMWLAAFALALAVAILTAYAGRRTSRTPTDGRPA